MGHAVFALPLGPLARASVVLLALTVAVAGYGASAHSGLARSEPAEGDALLRGPRYVRLWFTETLRDNGRNLIGVLDADGARMDEGVAYVDPEDRTHVWAPIEGALPAGEYRVEWRASSADGHPVEGVFAFRVAPNDPTAIELRQPELTPPVETASEAGDGADGNGVPRGVLIGLGFAVIAGGAAGAWLIQRRQTAPQR